MEDNFVQYKESEKFFTSTSNYIFNHNINEIWEIINHPAKLSNLLLDWADQFNYYEDHQKIELNSDTKMTFKINSILIFCWKNIFNCILRCKEIIQYEFYKRIVFDSFCYYPFKIKIIFPTFYFGIQLKRVLF